MNIIVYGAMLIDTKDSPFMDLHILKPGDKVYTLNKCNMTLYNFDHLPLVTVDFANPKIHQGDKSLQKEIGPALMMVFDGIRLHVKMNEKYINRDDGLGIEIHEKIEQLDINFNTKLGKELYDNFLKPDVVAEFEKLNIHVQPGEAISLEGEELNEPLYDIVTQKNILQKFFKMV
jgi:hypothetical protein